MQSIRRAIARHRHGHFLFLSLIAATFVLSVFVSTRIVNNLIDEAAQTTARNWADTLVVQGGEKVDQVLAGRELSAEDKAFFETIALVGNVFRYKIFGPDGTLVLVSDILEDTGRHSLQDHRPAIAQGIVGGLTFTETKDGRNNPDRPDVYAEVYLPYVKDGVVKGVIEAYIDHTDTSNLFRQNLNFIILLMAALAVISLGHAIYTGWLFRRKQLGDAHIYQLAHFDALTGTANRAHFLSQLELALEHDPRRPIKIALHALDLDHFKSVNDALGHAAGDALLQIVAQNIADTLSEGDVLARIGGDEFVILQRDVRGEKQASALANKLVNQVRSIEEIDGLPISASVSVGTALAPEHSDNIKELQKCADVALYHAKEMGRDQAHVFSTDMDEELRLRDQLRVTMRRAVEHGNVVVQYQPLHRAKDAKLCSFEALARLQDGNGKFIPPDVFIPVAEQMGLIGELGAFVLHEACKTATGWPSHLRVSVNFSPMQFKENVVAVVMNALDQSGLAPERLEVEVTESLFIEDPENVQQQLQKIKDLGVHIVMDDFGTGYSSLSYLWRFPFDKLKVDRSCFQSLEDAKVVEVLETISAMSKTMNLSITAEGIETPLQRDFAVNAGYDELQGFYFSPALPKSKLPLYILSESLESMNDDLAETTQPSDFKIASAEASVLSAKAS